MLHDEKLIKVSDVVFQEAEPPKDKSRPLEWRRGFNFVNLPLKNLKIVTSCNVHEFDDWEEMSVNPLKLVKPNISDNIAITGILDEDQMRDSIYYAVESKKEKRLFSLEGIVGIPEITLITGNPFKENAEILDGVYWGSAFRMNYEPKQDCLCFYLYIPKDQMLSLIAAIRADENATVEVTAKLLSFTFEVDDALREHYDSQDIVINDSNESPCFVSSVRVTSKIGNHSLQSESEADLFNEYEFEEADSPNEEHITPEQRSHQELLQVLLSYSKPLNNIVAALWTLIVVIVMYAFFK